MFADFLTGDPTRAKQELQKHVTKLVLTPRKLQMETFSKSQAMYPCFVGGKDDVVVTNSWERFAQHYIFRRFRSPIFASFQRLKLR